MSPSYTTSHRFLLTLKRDQLWASVDQIYRLLAKLENHFVCRVVKPEISICMVWRLNGDKAKEPRIFHLVLILRRIPWCRAVEVYNAFLHVSFSCNGFAPLVGHREWNKIRFAAVQPTPGSLSPPTSLFSGGDVVYCFLLRKHRIIIPWGDLSHIISLSALAQLLQW